MTAFRQGNASIALTRDSGEYDAVKFGKHHDNEGTLSRRRVSGWTFGFKESRCAHYTIANVVESDPAKRNMGS
jgi:hypothetical protein